MRYIEKWHSAIDKGMLEMHVHATYISTENLIDELRMKYQKFYNVINQRGNILEFLSQKQIKEIIKNNTNRLATNLEIYPTPQNRIELKKTEIYLNISGYFHIIESEVYEILHVTPIPHKIKEGVYSTIQTSTFTLAVNYNNQNYFELNEQKMSECSKEEEAYFCYPNMVSSMDTNPNCLLDEIYDRVPKTNCNTTQFTIYHAIWKQMKMGSPTTAAIVCRGEREDIVIKGIGIIHVGNDCFIKTKQNTLSSRISRQHKAVVSFHKTSAKINTTVPTLFDDRPSIKEPVLSSTDQLFGLPIEPEEIVPWSDVAKHSTSIVISIITTLTILLFFVRYRKHIQIMKCLWIPGRKREIHNEPNDDAVIELQPLNRPQGCEEVVSTIPQAAQRKISVNGLFTGGVLKTA